MHPLLREQDPPTRQTLWGFNGKTCRPYLNTPSLIVFLCHFHHVLILCNIQVLCIYKSYIQEWWGTAWTGQQSITGLFTLTQLQATVQLHTYGQFSVASWPNLLVGLWEETGALGENPHRHMENTRTLKTAQTGLLGLLGLLYIAQELNKGQIYRLFQNVWLFLLYH